MRLTRDLVELEFVTEGAALRSAGRGRPSETVYIRPESAHFAGIKLTGEALYAVVTDLHANTVRTEEHALASRSVDDVVALIVETAGRLSASYPRLAALGICLAGDVRVVHGAASVVGSHFLGWEDEVPLERLVAERTGLPTAISNDVQALTLAHHWFGAGVGCRSLAVIGFGAGIGAGLVVGDELVRGAAGHPGKVGHLFVTDDGPGCDAGHPGCVSAFVTIPAVLRNAGVSDLDALRVAFLAHEPRALAAVAAAGRALGVVIATLRNVVDVEKVVVTGEGLEVARWAHDQLMASLDERLDPAASDAALELRDFEFADYAWAAAITAIHHVV